MLYTCVRERGHEREEGHARTGIWRGQRNESAPTGHTPRCSAAHRRPRTRSRCGTEDAVAGGQGGGVELKMLETGQGTTCARVVHTRHAQQPALYLERSYSPTGGVKDTCPQSPPKRSTWIAP